MLSSLAMPGKQRTSEPAQASQDRMATWKNPGVAGLIPLGEPLFATNRGSSG